MADESLKQKTKKGIYWNALNQLSNYGLQFVVGIIVARILSPEDYGVVAMPLVFLALAQCFVDSGFGIALVRKPQVSDEDLSTAFYFSIIVGCICYTLLFIGSKYIAVFYNQPMIEDLLKVSALALLTGPLISVQRVQLTRKIDFRTPLIVDLSGRIVSGTIGILMAYRGYGVWALVIPSVCSNILSIILLYLKVRWLPKTGWSKSSFNYLWGYGGKMLISRLIDVTYCNIMPVVVGKFYSAKDLGNYTRAQNYAQLPSQQISAILIQNVSFPVLSKIQDDYDKFKDSFVKLLKLSTYIVFPLVLGVAAVAKPLIIVMLTEKWLSCVIYLQLLCFANLIFPFHVLNVYVLIIKGRSDWYLKLEIYKKILGVSIILCTVQFGLIYMIIGEILNSILAIFINTYYTRRLVGISLKEQIKLILPSLILSMTMFCCILFITNIISNMFISLIVSILLGVSYYILGSYIFNFSEINEVKYMLSKNK